MLSAIRLTIPSLSRRWIATAIAGSAPVQGQELAAEMGAEHGHASTGGRPRQLSAASPPRRGGDLSSCCRFWRCCLRCGFSGRAITPRKQDLKAQPISSSSDAGLPLHAANREAEEFYLKGRYYWEKRTPDSLNKAVDSFTQAVVHDPGYAPAYVGLADCYNLLREYTVMPASEAYPRALAAAKKAVELDPPVLRGARLAGFCVFLWYVGLLATADREFRRAIELNASNGRAHHWYATYLASRRRFPEALAEIDRAQALEPASKSVLADKGSILFDAGWLQEATALLQQMAETEPDFVSPHRYLALIYLQTGDYPHYLVQARSEAVLMHDSSALAVVEATENGFAAGGGKGLLKALREQQTRFYERGQLSPYFLASTCSLLGNKQDALRYLKIAYAQHLDGMTSIATNRAFDNLHNEPAFQQLVTEVGLPPLS